MQVIFLVWIDDRLVETSTYTLGVGVNLNATAKKILEEIREDVPDEELHCAFYLVVGRRLAFAGEERLEGEDCED